MKQTAIYISELRGETQIHNVQIKSTLSYGTYVSPYRLPIGSLLHINEWIGVDREPITLTLQNEITILIPTVGDIVIDIAYQSFYVPLGKLLMLKTMHGDKVLIHQDGAEEVGCSFLQFVFSGCEYIEHFVVSKVLPVADIMNRNKMMPISCEYEMGFDLYFGVFVGKSSYQMEVVQDGSTIHFVFVISGTIEIEERILNQGDSLLLRGYSEIDMECLSGGSIIFLIQLH